MNDENIERVNIWFAHLKHGIVLAQQGHFITWVLLLILLIREFRH